MITVSKRRHFGQGIYRIKKLDLNFAIIRYLQFKSQNIEKQGLLVICSSEAENSENRGQGQYIYSLEVENSETRSQDIYSLEAKNSETRDNRYLQFRGQVHGYWRSRYLQVRG